MKFPFFWRKPTQLDIVLPVHHDANGQVPPSVQKDIWRFESAYFRLTGDMKPDFMLAAGAFCLYREGSIGCIETDWVRKLKTKVCLNIVDIDLFFDLAEYWNDYPNPCLWGMIITPPMAIMAAIALQILRVERTHSRKEYEMLGTMVGIMTTIACQGNSPLDSCCLKNMNELYEFTEDCVHD